MIKNLRLIQFCFTALLSLSFSACTEDEVLGPASPEMIQLGEYIFHDKNLSEPRGVACVSCHVEPLAFTGNNGSPINSVALGSLPRSIGSRNSPSIIYSKFSPIFHFKPEIDETHGSTYFEPVGGQFWDGRALTLTEQAKGPFLNPVEMNNPSVSVVIEKIRNSPYAGLFASTFGGDAFADDDAAYQHLANAISAYERSLESKAFTSKFDAVLAGYTQLTPQEAYGFQLFKDPSKGNCLHCHEGDEGSRDSRRWLFTDFSYENLGVPRNHEIPANRTPSFFDLGLCQQTTLRSVTAGFADLSQFCGYFKTPTLRNIAITGPYMHNGVFRNLRDVVAFYASRDSDPQRWYGSSLSQRSSSYFNDIPSEYSANVTQERPFGQRPGQPSRLSEAEIDAIVAFLYTLTDQGLLRR